MVPHTCTDSAFPLGADDELCQGEDGARPALKRLMKNYTLLCRCAFHHNFTFTTTISPQFVQEEYATLIIIHQE
jgi:hypothetical protein